MNKAIDLTGKRFGRLKVISYHENDKYSHKVWKCKCDCGNIHYATTSDLRCGRTTSCGCYQREYTIIRNKTHDLTHSRLYRTYHHMIERCYKKYEKSYKSYGGRGIKVCDEWLSDFMNFYNWAMKNGYSDDLTIDRIDVNGNYEPSNCRWVDMKTQSNNRRNSILIKYQDKNVSLKEYARLTNQKYSTLYHRYRKQGCI